MFLDASEYWLELSTWTMLITGLVTFVATLFISAPYGRYNDSKGWGFLIPARLAWIVMETPNVWIPLFFLFYWKNFCDAFHQSPVNKCLLGFFLCHYVHRSLVYPFQKSAKDAPMPITVMMLAFFFCSWNGLQQSLALLNVHHYPSEWFTDIRFIIGSILAVVGMAINIHADYYLLKSRQIKMATITSTGTKSKYTDVAANKYVIPRGGLFEYVSCANYSGEILEWIGFAIACWSLAATAFAVYTFCNTGTRAYKHHLWYLTKFKEEYPKNRKAVIPFIW